MRNILKKAISTVTAVALLVGVVVPSQNAQAANKVSRKKFWKTYHGVRKLLYLHYQKSIWIFTN